MLLWKRGKAILTIWLFQNYELVEIMNLEYLVTWPILNLSEFQDNIKDEVAKKREPDDNFSLAILSVSYSAIKDV